MLSAQLVSDISSTGFCFIDLPNLILAVELGSIGIVGKRGRDHENLPPRLCERLRARAGVASRLSLVPTPHELGFTNSGRFPPLHVMISSDKVAQTGSNPIFDTYFEVEMGQPRFPWHWLAFRAARM